jgi:hypothetical protein
MSEQEVAELQAKMRSRTEMRTGPAAAATANTGSGLVVWLAWAAVGIPLAWGIWITLEKALVLFE